MTTKLMEERGIRTVNLDIELHDDLMRMKVDKEARSLSDVIAYLYNFKKGKGGGK